MSALCPHDFAIYLRGLTASAADPEEEKTGSRKGMWKGRRWRRRCRRWRHLHIIRCRNEQELRKDIETFCDFQGVTRDYKCIIIYLYRSNSRLISGFRIKLVIQNGSWEIMHKMQNVIQCFVNTPSVYIIQCASVHTVRPIHQLIVLWKNIVYKKDC